MPRHYSRYVDKTAYNQERYSTLDINIHMENIDRITTTKIEELFKKYVNEARSILVASDLEDEAFVDVQIIDWDRII